MFFIRTGAYDVPFVLINPWMNELRILYVYQYYIIICMKIGSKAGHEIFETLKNWSFWTDEILAFIFVKSLLLVCCQFIYFYEMFTFTSYMHGGKDIQANCFSMSVLSKGHIHGAFFRILWSPHMGWNDTPILRYSYNCHNFHIMRAQFCWGFFKNQFES